MTVTLINASTCDMFGEEGVTSIFGPRSIELSTILHYTIASTLTLIKSLLFSMPSFPYHSGGDKSNSTLEFSILQNY